MENEEKIRELGKRYENAWKSLNEWVSEAVQYIDEDDECVALNDALEAIEGILISRRV